MKKSIEEWKVKCLHLRRQAGLETGMKGGRKWKRKLTRDPCCSMDVILLLQQSWLKLDSGTTI